MYKAQQNHRHHHHHRQRTGQIGIDGGQVLRVERRLLLRFGKSGTGEEKDILPPKVPLP